MGARNISISDEAYTRLAALKKSGESFTDVINRLTQRRSILELAGMLTPQESEKMRGAVREIRASSAKRLATTSRRVEGS